MDRKRGQLVYVTIALLLCSVQAGVFAIAITVTGSWSETINENDLQGGPGTDLVSTYESAADEIIIDIYDTGVPSWKVEVHKVDTNWHANFTLSVRRTSDGSGGGSINGGLTYSEITDTDSQFFTGQDDRSNVDCQLQLEGVSVQIPPDTYTTTVYYTVSDQGS